MAPGLAYWSPKIVEGDWTQAAQARVLVLSDEVTEADWNARQLRADGTG